MAALPGVSEESFEAMYARGLDEHGPHRGRRIQEAVALVASLPPDQLARLARFLTDEAAMLSCGAHGSVPDHETADAYRAVVALLRVLHEEQ